VNVERSLSIECTISPVEPANCALSTGVIPTILTARQGVEIEVDANAVLACPFETSKQISPADIGYIWVSTICCHSPVWIWDSDMVKSCCLDVDEVLLCYEGRIMLLDC